jgi:hypothetical protein
LKETDQRQHANFYLNIPGETCVIYGGLQCLQQARQMIEELVGELFDTWFKRLDLCLDLPGVSLTEAFLPAFRENQFVTSASRWNAWDGREGVSGFTAGSNKRLQLNVYDKLREVSRKSELYQRAMKLRWGGTNPASATRIEHQIRKQWLDQFILIKADDVLQSLPAIVDRLTEIVQRPFFVLTAEAVDRLNKHQGRTQRLPAWLQAVATFRTLAGAAPVQLERVQRSQLSCPKAIRTALGYLTTAAANRDACVTTVHEVVEFLREMLELNDLTDADVAQSWEKKARQLGIYRSSQDFPFGSRNDQPPEPQEDHACF